MSKIPPPKKTSVCVRLDCTCNCIPASVHTGVRASCGEGIEKPHMFYVRTHPLSQTCQISHQFGGGFANSGECSFFSSLFVTFGGGEKISWPPVGAFASGLHRGFDAIHWTIWRMWTGDWLGLFFRWWVHRNLTVLRSLNAVTVSIWIVFLYITLAINWPYWFNCDFNFCLWSLLKLNWTENLILPDEFPEDAHAKSFKVSNTFTCVRLWYAFPTH